MTNYCTVRTNKQFIHHLRFFSKTIENPSHSTHTHTHTHTYFLKLRTLIYQYQYKYGNETKRNETKRKQL